MTYTHLTTNEFVMIEAYYKKEDLPWKVKRKPNGHSEKRGKQAVRRDLRDRAVIFPNFKTEFGHLEGDTIVGEKHKSAVITLVEGLSKAIITLKTDGRKASDIDIFFADPGCPGQRDLNEHSNGLLIRNGLPKQIDFTTISQKYLSAISDKRNRIPKKLLNYQTPYRVFLSYLKKSNLI